MGPPLPFLNLRMQLAVRVWGEGGLAGNGCAQRMEPRQLIKCLFSRTSVGLRRQRGQRYPGEPYFGFQLGTCTEFSLIPIAPKGFAVIHFNA